MNLHDSSGGHFSSVLHLFSRVIHLCKAQFNRQAVTFGVLAGYPKARDNSRTPPTNASLKTFSPLTIAVFLDSLWHIFRLVSRLFIHWCSNANFCSCVLYVGRVLHVLQSPPTVQKHTHKDWSPYFACRCVRVIYCWAVQGVFLAITQ